MCVQCIWCYAERQDYSSKPHTRFVSPVTAGMDWYSLCKNQGDETFMITVFTSRLFPMKTLTATGMQITKVPETSFSKIPNSNSDRNSWLNPSAYSCYFEGRPLNLVQFNDHQLFACLWEAKHSNWPLIFFSHVSIWRRHVYELSSNLSESKSESIETDKVELRNRKVYSRKNKFLGAKDRLFCTTFPLEVTHTHRCTCCVFAFWQRIRFPFWYLFFVPMYLLNIIIDQFFPSLFAQQRLKRQRSKAMRSTSK